MGHDFWKGRSVFVTGGTGLLGGWLLKSLLERDAEVVVLSRDHVPHCMAVREKLLEHVTVVHGDLSDHELLRRTLAEYSIQTVFHLAAQTLVGVAKRDPMGTLEANVRGTWNLLEAARQIGGVQVLVASSDKAYGASPALPYLESHPLRGEYPYDASKSCVDLIAGMYATSYGMPIGIVRCANLFGGGDLNFSRFIPGLVMATLKGEPLVIRSDGQFVRDYLYVEDGAEAYLTLAEHLAKDASLNGHAFNFSLEMQFTVLELVDKILALMGRPELKPIIQNAVSTEIRVQYASCEKARQLLGWRPRFSLEQGLLRTIEWYRGLLEATQPQAAAMGAGR